VPGKIGISCRDYNPRIASRVPASLRNPVGHRADQSREVLRLYRKREQARRMHKQGVFARLAGVVK